MTTLGGAYLQTRMAWRVYLHTKHFDFYCYTVMGCLGSKGAIEAVREIITPGDLPLTARLVTISEDELPRLLEPLPL